MIKNRIVLLLLNTVACCKGYNYVTNSTANIQVLAWYFPQFHPFPENDQNWGKGFTDWSLVKPSPAFNTFGVPVRKPSELGYYNLLDKGIREKQGQLAREYGVDGFIFYHYWLENRPVMSEVLAKRLLDGEPNIPFMMCLVNEPWQAKFYNLKTKKLGSGELLLRMLYDEPEKLFNYLLPFFQHKDYIKVEGKPVYVIYRSPTSTAFENAINMLRRLAIQHGFTGLHIVQCLQHYGRASYIQQWADAGLEFAPNLDMVDRECGTKPPYGEYECNDNSTYYFNQVPVSPSWSRKSWTENIEMVKARHFRATHDMVNARCVYNLQGSNKPVYRGGTVAWDATPRYPLKKGEALPKQRIIPPPVFASTPEKFFKATVSRMCKVLCDSNTKNHPNFYALFAWNEWGEGATLEPNLIEGRAYLEALKAARVAVNDHWPKGCTGECKHMSKARYTRNCHANEGCFSAFGCFMDSNQALMNSGYGLDVEKRVTENLDSGRGTYFSTLKLALADNGYIMEAGKVHRSGWPAVMQHLIDTGRVVDDDSANLLMVDCLSWWFFNKDEPLRTPWIGFVHVVGQLPAKTPQGNGKGYGLSLSMMDILPLANFQASLPFCKGLITVSPSWQPWFARLPDLQRHKIPVFVVKHPIVHPGGGNPFSLKKLLSYPKKRVILLGQQYRRVATIYALHSRYPKFWMGGYPANMWKPIIDRRIKAEMKADEVPEERYYEVTVYRTATPEEYDSMLKKNLIVIDLWAATANNAVTECMKLGIPMLVRRLDAIVDYLGPDYPLYFESMEELQSILNDSKRLEKLLTAAHHYLLSLDTSDLTVEKFGLRLNDVLKQITLPARPALVAPGRKPKVLLFVPNHDLFNYTASLIRSITHVRKSFPKSQFDFSCTVIITRTGFHSIDQLKQLCRVKFILSPGGFNLTNLIVPADFDYVALLRQDVNLKLTHGSHLLAAMQEFGFEVISPSVEGWREAAMRPHPGCEAHRTDFIDLLFAVFNRRVWLCFQSFLNQKIDKFGVGYDVTLSALCEARMGVYNQQLIVPDMRVSGLSIGNSSEDHGVQRSREMYGWISHMMGLKDEVAAEKWRVEVTVKRPREFPYCQMPLSNREELEWARTL